MTTTWAQSELSLLFHMGFPFTNCGGGGCPFLNYQTSLNLEDLPETKVSYVGQDPDAAWRAPAAERIAQIRKGEAGIMVYDEAGLALEGAQIHIEDGEAPLWIWNGYLCQ